MPMFTNSVSVKFSKITEIFFGCRKKTVLSCPFFSLSWNYLRKHCPFKKKDREFTEAVPFFLFFLDSRKRSQINYKVAKSDKKKLKNENKLEKNNNVLFWINIELILIY